MNNVENAIRLLTVAKSILERDIVDCNKQPLNIGDLVKDEKNEEYGIYLGVKPNESEIGENNITEPRKPDNASTVLILMTFNISDTNLSWRIRYTGKNKVKVLIPKGQIGSDLKKFCNNQCIMDCSESCKLWKYGKKD